MQTPTTFAAASAQAAAIPESIDVALSTGASATVHRLSWLQFEALWGELAQLLVNLTARDLFTTKDTKSPKVEETLEPELSELSVLSGEDSLFTALAAAPQLVLRLAAQCLRLPESELAAWPPADVLGAAAAGLELNFIAPGGVRDFFAAIARLGK